MVKKQGCLNGWRWRDKRCIGPADVPLARDGMTNSCNDSDAAKSGKF
ncbi:MAG: hypothetical protein M5U34_31360 [Chloroflexi bacterium]|nr:hypothetical protein [Chloroflexota bacterium]